MKFVCVLTLLGLAFLVSPIASFGIHDSSFLSDSSESSPSSDPFTTAEVAAENILQIQNLDRRKVLKTMLVAGTTTMLIPTRRSNAETSQAPEKSNFNYDLGKGDCQTSCVLKCGLEVSSKNANTNGSDCIDACVRSGQRYCHQTAASKWSPSAQEATTSRYLPTTMEPIIQSSKPIPGLLYNSNRGGAWRD